MAFLFACPHCQSQTLIENEYSGLSGDCASCGQPITIPDFAGYGPPELQESPGTRSPNWLRWGAAAVLVVVAVGSVVFAVARIGGTTLAQVQLNRMRQRDADNLSAIAKAFNAYAADHGVYPPPMVADDQGRPLHSWRVLILPYLGYSDLYNQYDFDRPWDVNADAIYTIPREYQGLGGVGFTFESHYYLVVGPGTLFPTPTSSLGPRQIDDGANKTVLIVESRQDNAVTANWMEPVDLDIRSMQLTIGGGTGTEIGGGYEDGAMIATADGRSHFLRSNVSPQEISALLSPAGGEPLPDDILD